MRLPEAGSTKDEILDRLAAKRASDVRWQEGRTFGMIYDAGPEADEVLQAVAAMFLHDNALNTLAFPSLGEIQSEVVGITADLLHGTEAAGFITSGGTESILMAVKAARERGRAERGVTRPEMVLPVSAHAAFHKAAHYFGITVRKIPVDADWRADVEAAAAAISDDTVLVVGSAPQYPQGVVDPIPELAALAAAAGANFHTDACMGGFVLPFMERLGHPVPPWDFRVDGVTSISADIHKLGYAPKGASVVLHRDKSLRRFQTFVFDDWLGGFYASPNMQGTRAGLPMACAWAILHHLGLEGYLRLTEATIEARQLLVEGVMAQPGLRVLGEPQAHLVAISADPGAEPTLDIFAVGDVLLARGWFHDRQTPPDSLHATVSAGNRPVIGDYLRDLAESVAEVGGGRVEDRSTSYSTLE
ncbi:pyridoxal phosphate-dependent decarboxylase family protein [Dermatobacter hominis]|uniref:pyridoxal phosphate-dependent decarboxylase family protein n=1 Tax=Dermatobacter hominis TaxID=2884263 RepID=UPI001D0F9D5C|nr:aminotransferase class V-fold PLP-dependent enzyme [Dermatobacter hominis]UDY37621.1 aminotransferase class V-fold PLP-dependent enzyme [Dermatobacter hominis]